MRIKPVKSCYTADQIFEYLEHVKFVLPLDCDAGSLEADAFDCTLDNLETIMRLHLLSFPFENTAMH